MSEPCGWDATNLGSKTACTIAVCKSAPSLTAIESRSRPVFATRTTTGNARAYLSNRPCTTRLPRHSLTGSGGTLNPLTTVCFGGELPATSTARSRFTGSSTTPIESPMSWNMERFPTGSRSTIVRNVRGVVSPLHIYRHSARQFIPNSRGNVGRPRVEDELCVRWTAANDGSCLTACATCIRADGSAPAIPLSPGAR